MTSEMEANFRWFVHEMPSLFEKFGRCHVIVRKMEVVGVYDSYSKACEVAGKLFNPGEYNIQEVGPDESAYTVYIAGAWA